MTKHSKPQTLFEHIYSQRQLHSKPHVGTYLCAFYKKDTGEFDFYKIGCTGKKKACLRFFDPDYPEDAHPYRHWDIKIICEVRLPPVRALELEWDLQQQYPKNFWIPKEYKFKGIREVFRTNEKSFKTKMRRLFKQFKQDWPEYN
jgi:hypothetical protein